MIVVIISGDRATGEQPQCTACQQLVALLQWGWHGQR